MSWTRLTYKLMEDIMALNDKELEELEKAIEEHKNTRRVAEELMNPVGK